MNKFEKFLQYWLAPLFILFFIWVASFALGKALLSMIVAFFLAYLFFPLILILESKKINRTVSVIAVFTVFTLLSVLFIIFVFPVLLNEATGLIKVLPGYVLIFMERLSLFAGKYGIDLPIQRDSLHQIISQLNLDFGSQFFSSFSSILQKILSGLQNIFDVALALTLLPVFFFYLVLYFENILITARGLVPPRYLTFFNSFLTHSDRVLSGFIRGQILLCVIFSIYYSVLLSIIGLPFGFLVGFLGGVISFIPYVGFASAFLTSVFIALFHSEGTQMLFILVLIVFLFAQLVESFYLTPKIVGDKVGLSAFETILSIIVLTNLLGFLGVVLAVPLAGVLKFILRELLSSYRKSDFYLVGRSR